MSSGKTLTGVGGWLALLVAGLIVLGPLVGASRLLIELQTAEQTTPQLIQSTLWTSYKWSSWAIFAVTAAISISAGVALNRRHRPGTVAYTVACLWVAGPVGNFAYLVAAVLIFGEKASAEALPEMLGGITGAILGSAIWTAYLLLSKRVKNTYYGSASSQIDAHLVVQTDPADGELSG